MRWLKIVFVVCAVAFGAIQFVRPARNHATAPSRNDIFAHHPAPPDVKHLVQVACYDCHSHTTRYPWYAEVQPLGWWLADHVREGKGALNFSEFAGYSARRAIRRLESSIDHITDGEMPLESYRLTHPDARLTSAQIAQLTTWFEDVVARIEDGAEAGPAVATGP